MIYRSLACQRGGVSLVECALVYPVTFMLILGMIIGGLGIFRYQQVAALAREAARWASVHGGQYAQESGNPAATPQDVYNNVIQPNAIGLDLSKLTYSVTWDDNGKMPSYINSSQQVRTNRVHVTLTYQWVAEAYFATVSLTSTSEMVVSY